MHDIEKFKKICKDFENKRKIRITESARKLIFSTLVAIEEDPLPTWNIEITSPEKVTEYFGLNLFRYLEQISRITFPRNRISIRRSVKKITFFDVLHWLAPRLDSLCPFIKD